MTEHFGFVRDGAFAIVTLNRPDRLNALTDPMRDRISELFAEMALDDSVHVVILNAA